MSPLDRYPTGVLHPIDPDLSGIDPASTDREAAEPGLLDESDDLPDPDGESKEQSLAKPARRRRYVPPSSVGFSCCVRGDVRLAITASAAVYRQGGERDSEGRFLGREYTRTPLPEVTVCWSGASPLRPPDLTIWEGRAGIDVRARTHGDGFILTVTLCNRRELDPQAQPRHRTRDRVGKALLEARLECTLERGELLEYPRVDPSLLTDEERELELQYRERRIYAVGHGAAAAWKVEGRGGPRIWSDFMPESEVPMMTADTGGEDGVLDLAHLAEAPRADVLVRFTAGYAEWIAEQMRTASKLPTPDAQATAHRMCERMGTALGRMRRCVEMLRTDPLAAEAFRVANRAMLDQMRQGARVSGRKVESYRWRPFQLAFLLTVMESAIREEDDYRDVLDLIWFPTGGGKTEAYLGLIAFLIAWRRLKYPDSGGGTVSFMRYTLRLLTRQQFERAARMVCALELIRRRSPERLGVAPVDIGIWVGGEISPNGIDQAAELVEEIRAGRQESRYRLLLERCPWCGTPFDAERGYRAGDEEFHFHCVDDDCEFGAGELPLPCNVVDEALYRRPPSLLIGTIDKFARLAWDERTGALFGAGTGSRPPELVIQDELHLITGPLGSVAGLYEAGIDTLLVRRGVRPKYVASTATIRMAAEQVRRLYARDLAVFPPPGLSHDDSYFARTDRERPGRLYVGYLAPLLDQQHCLAPLAAALLAAPEALFDADADRDALLDAWWTQVLYHGSLKGVGNSHNAFVTHVRDFGRRLAGELEEGSAAGPGDGIDDAGAEPDDSASRFQDTRIAQLTSHLSAEENAATFLRLAHSRENEACLDAVLATNMVSVGLDVARLALMIVNGQPLTTAEYIQATSRVGRADVPGLVVANYYRHQARSLSHYESFRPYHESFYRFVEPSSVTPFTYQVRSRALHAALVIALRHACAGLRDNSSAGSFDRHSQEVRVVTGELKRRCERAAADGHLGPDTAAHIDRLTAQWHDEARRCEHERRQLKFQGRNDDRAFDRLLFTHGDSRPGLWATLHSMRNIEGTGVLKVHDRPAAPMTPRPGWKRDGAGKRKPEGDEVIAVRLSHLLRDCSVGAIVRGPKSLMVVQDIRTWDRPGSDPMEREIRYVHRVRSALGIDAALCAPPRSAERNGTVIGWIPALRFPTWMRCLRCGFLHRAPWRRRPRPGSEHRESEAGTGTEVARCRECGDRLEQVPWVLVHEEGYLADVPWHAMAHEHSRNPEQSQCRPDWARTYLRLEEDAADRRIVCSRCGSSGRLRSGAFPQIPFPPFAWQQPWIPEPPARTPDSFAWLVEINDVRVHSPLTRTALVIPPESRIRRGTVTDRLYVSSRNQQRIRAAKSGLARKSVLKRLASEYRCIPGEIESALAEIEEGYPLFGQVDSEESLLAAEYRALIEKIPELRDDEDFVTDHHTEGWNALRRTLDAESTRRAAGTVSRLIAVNRLKEIMVLMGFQRAGGRPTRPDITGESPWLPALELYGEGIFFTLNEEVLQRWESGEALRERADAFARRYVRRAAQVVPELEVQVSPRFLLCHTLAHLLIRELDAEAGYPAASLKERIYCATGRDAMAGILIYVAVADEEGSLGGLMELAKPERFLRLLTGAIGAASWCSLDPVCSEQEGHGPGLLNRAACHACALLPETSCPYGNVLLDRAFVKGAAPDITAFVDCTEAAS